MSFVIETSGLSKSFGPVRAVDSISLSVRQGEIYGVVGLNGAGKTTTIRALLGMVRPSSGSVKVMGQPVGPNGRGPWQRVGYIVETPAAYPELTVTENLEIARRLHRVPDRNAASRVIEHLGIAPYAGRKAGTLSTGNLQRLGLARALLHEPDVLIMDEPTSGLDPNQIREVRDLIRELGRTKTILLSTHILQEVEAVASRAILISGGRIVFDGGIDRALTGPMLSGLFEYRLETFEQNGRRFVSFG